MKTAESIVEFRGGIAEPASTSFGKYYPSDFQIGEVRPLGGPIYCGHDETHADYGFDGFVRVVGITGLTRLHPISIREWVGNAAQLERGPFDETEILVEIGEVAIRHRAVKVRVRDRRRAPEFALLTDQEIQALSSRDDS